MRYDNRNSKLMPHPMPMILFQSMPENDYTLQDDRIDIWQYSLLNDFKEASSLLSEDELTRANRYHFARHQRRFLIARATLRLILSHYINIPADKLTFDYDKHGKPRVKNELSLQFNLSHSQDTALLAIGKHFPLGIDLEFFSARPYDGIANHSFSSHEKESFNQIDTRIKPLVFFHIWAQKEALIKACGLGLSYPTRDFDVPVNLPTNQLVFDSKHNKEWQMISFMPKAACCGALCYHPCVKTIRYNQLFDESIQ